MSDQNTIRITLSKQNSGKVLLEYCFMYNAMLLFVLLYSDYNKWNVFILNMVVKPKIGYHGIRLFKNLNFAILQY